jgi:hypothetical protein
MRGRAVEGQGRGRYTPSLSPPRIASSYGPIAPAVAHQIAVAADASVNIASGPIYTNPRHAGPSFTNYRASRFPHNCQLLTALAPQSALEAALPEAAAPEAATIKNAEPAQCPVIADGPPSPPPWLEPNVFSTDPDHIVCRKC